MSIALRPRALLAMALLVTGVLAWAALRDVASRVSTPLAADVVRPALDLAPALQAGPRLGDLRDLAFSAQEPQLDVQPAPVRRARAKAKAAAPTDDAERVTITFPDPGFRNVQTRRMPGDRGGISRSRRPGDDRRSSCNLPGCP